ncbi:helix-turn-helix transcriptional regulator [bacterium]|jgi:DNA-binding CsgD family transcriptional regulator|nr:helix-turn-helix transcriptional regulator [bacterium]
MKNSTLTLDHIGSFDRIFTKHLSNAIDAIGKDRLPALLIKLIKFRIKIDAAILIIYRPKSKPVLLSSTFKEKRAKLGLSNYINDTYVLNPAYLSFKKGETRGITKITEISGKDSIKSAHYTNYKIKEARDEDLGFLTEGWPERLEEISILFDLPNKEMGELAIFKKKISGFNKTDLNTLQILEPLIYSILKNHWTTTRDNTIFKNTRANQNKRYENFGEKILSPREIEVAQLIFEGHSGNSIAANLDIAITTVKSHRKNMYKKLGIGSQQELFSRYIDSISL